MRNLILAGSMLMAVAGSAAAQFGGDRLNVYPTDFSFRFGAFLPFDTQMNDVSGTFFNLGVEYILNRQSTSDTYLALDWFARSLSADRANVFPITINRRSYRGVNLFGDRQAYWFLGIGAFVFDWEGTQTVLGLRGGVGTQITATTFAEFALYLSDRASNGVRATGVALNFGYRF
jgi:hypothetical protein